MSKEQFDTEIMSELYYKDLPNITSADVLRYNGIYSEKGTVCQQIFTASEKLQSNLGNQKDGSESSVEMEN